MDFRPEGYSMTLQLTSQRKAPIVTRRRWLRPSAWGAGRRETVELLI